MESWNFSSGGGKKKEQPAKNCQVSDGRDALGRTITCGGLDARKGHRGTICRVKAGVWHRESHANIFKDAVWPGGRVFGVSGSRFWHQEGHDGSPSEESGREGRGNRERVCLQVE